MRSLALTLAVALGALTVPSKDAAARRRKPDYKRASKAYRTARAHYKAEKYVLAAKEYLKAYKYSMDASMYWNVGDAYEKGNKLKLALKFYKRYLATRKAADEKQKVKADIKRVQEKLKAPPPRPLGLPPGGEEPPGPTETRPTPARPTEPARPPETRPATPPGTEGPKVAVTSRPEPRPTEPARKVEPVRPVPRPEVPRKAAEPVKAPSIKEKPARKPKEPKPTTTELAAWAMVGVTAVLLTVTGVMALKVEDAEDQMTRLAVSRDPYTALPYPYSDPYKREYEKYEKNGKLYEKLTWTFAGISGATAVTAVVLFTLNYLKKPKRKERAGRAIRFTPQITDKGAAMGLAVDF